MKRIISSNSEIVASSDVTSIFIVQGYSDAGYFINERFDNLKDALNFFDSNLWQEGEVVETRFTKKGREYITHREITNGYIEE